MYAKINNNVVESVMLALPRNHENVSRFDLASPEVLALYGFAAVETSVAPTFSRFERVVTTYEVVDGAVKQVHTVEALPESVQQEMIEGAKMTLRTTRSALLAETDWTQTLDAPIGSAKQAEFRTYRQALRDLPEITADAFEVQWPQKPVL